MILTVVDDVNSPLRQIVGCSEICKAMQKRTCVSRSYKVLNPVTQAAAKVLFAHHVALVVNLWLCR